ncbi:hypothetical protein [Flavisolibacter tropicus]|uniref:Uncharacterized protein n=1 Tax=Flavisolibacter tropicus TaxID=1492898 RepID=A0A172TVJ8_9BACT|nr:hypothetical protein [Flavisolibacter tropicus]ANE51006.1 hypothetical protein SY85_11325 [Flavisolibacter tropicus]
MRRPIPPIFKDLLWLGISFLLSVLLLKIVLNYNLFSGVAIAMEGSHITYPALLYFVPVFLLLSFVVFFIRQTTLRFSRKWTNGILVLTGAFFIITVALLNDFLGQFNTGTSGWTSYPPLSGLPEEETITARDTTLTNLIFIGKVLQIIVGVALLFITYKWGRQRSSR